MIGTHRQAGNTRVAMIWLLLLTLALRSLLAPGMMPAFSADVGPLITICTPNGERTIPASGDDGSRATHADAPCLFAAAGFTTLGAVTGPTLWVPVDWRSFTPWLISPSDTVGFGPDRVHARGPPTPPFPTFHPASIA